MGLDTDNERSRGIKNRLIQFGMSDVERTINIMLETIKGAAITGFNKMAGILLHQYLSSQELVSGSKEVDIEGSLQKVGNYMKIKMCIY